MRKNIIIAVFVALFALTANAQEGLKRVYNEQIDPLEQIDALEWLKAHQSWDAKRWIQGALFDGSAKVRAAAAKYIADIHYFTFVKDVRAAYEAETDAEAKKIIGESLEKMLDLSKKTQ